MSSARGVFSGAVPRVWHGTPPHRGRRGVTRGAASRAAATPNDASSNLGTDSGKTSASPSSANAFAAVPHSGYHRQVGFKRSFFEGWYFRVTLPDVRDNLSLIYHVYDPDLPESSRRVAGAQVCTPGGGYLFRESKNVDAFVAAAHEMELRMPMGGGEFFEVSDDGRRHRGRLLKGDTEEDAKIWPAKKRRSVVEWDFVVAPKTGYGGLCSVADGDGENEFTQEQAVNSVDSGSRVGFGNGKKKTSGRSTAGWLSSLPVFEPHYQILLAHGDATGQMTVDGLVTKFTNAPAYAEKNWGGAGFPSKWFWVQCNSFPEHPGLSITATGANRGVVLFPGMREEVAGVLIHTPDGQFFPFLPIPGSDGISGGKKDEASEVAWEVQPWGAWRVTASNSRYEVEVFAYIAPEDRVPGNTTVLRAPVDDKQLGMKPSCREHFRGQIVVNLWEREGMGWGSGRKGRVILDNATSNVAAVEVGGGPWDEPWSGVAEMREPLSTLAGCDVDVGAVAEFFKPFGDVAPGL